MVANRSAPRGLVNEKHLLLILEQTRHDLEYQVQFSEDLMEWHMEGVELSWQGRELTAVLPKETTQGFVRVKVRLRE